MPVKIALITAEETLPLRQAVLRPQCKISDLCFEGDNHTSAYHWGAFDEQRLIGICTIFPDPSPTHLDTTDKFWFRIRGMAVLPEYQGQGIGQKLLEQAFQQISKSTAKVDGMWCNARFNATGLYKKFGMATQGELFEVPLAGPHYYMEIQFKD